MRPNDKNDTPLDIIHISDERPDDAMRQLTAYKRKMQLLLSSWREGFSTKEIGRDYPLDTDELIQLRSSNDSQLLAEYRLEDGTRLRFDYDEERTTDTLVVSAYEATGEVLTIEGSLAEQYDQLAGLLYSCTTIDNAP